MNFKSIFKTFSLALLTLALAQSALAMEKSVNKLNKALIKAAKKGNTANIKDALQHGADINCKHWNNWTPLHYASFKGHFDAVKALLDAGANTDPVPLWGTAAAIVPNIDVQVTIKDGSNINLSGETALDKAKTPEIKKLISDEIEKRKKQQELQEYSALVRARLVARPHDLTITNLLATKRK